jgi:hypothetical protein
MRHYKNVIGNLVFVVVTFFSVCVLTAHAQGNANPQNAGTQNPNVENSIQSLSVTTELGGKLILKLGLKNTLANPPRGSHRRNLTLESCVVPILCNQEIVPAWW